MVKAAFASFNHEYMVLNTVNDKKSICLIDPIPYFSL